MLEQKKKAKPSNEIIIKKCMNFMRSWMLLIILNFKIREEEKWRCSIWAHKYSVYLVHTVTSLPTVGVLQVSYKIL